MWSIKDRRSSFGSLALNYHCRLRSCPVADPGGGQGGGHAPPPNQTKIIFCRMHQKRHYESKMDFFSSAQPLQTIRTAKYNQINPNQYFVK